MRAVDPFVRAALIGIGRDQGAATTTGTPVDALVETHDERGFLLRAGARDLYVRAGFKPPRVADTVDAAPAETLRGCSARLATLLAEVVQENDAEVLHAVLSELGAARLQVPHALLPNILGVHDRKLRAAAAPVLGERGRWLARQSPAWSWATGIESTDVAALWEEGNEEQQVEALRAMRATDAADARAKLTERLPKERAEQRAALLGALEAALSPADEELLERMLDDRSVAVKSAAARLLSQLPSSAFVLRMQARAEAAAGPAPQEAPSLWSRVKSMAHVGAVPKLAIEPPVELDAAAARDIAVPKSVQGGTRALALTQIVAAVPLSWWTTRYAATPEQLVAAARANDWSASIIEGWAFAAARQRHADWARSLVHETTLEAAHRTALARTLRLDDLLALLTTIDVANDTWPVAELLDAVPKPWPRAFAHDWLARMRRGAISTDARESYALAATALIAARALPADAFYAVAGEWPVTDESWLRGEWLRRLAKLQQIIRIRQTIAEERET
jgi:Family of unknown function (DUF5691)